MRQTIHERSRRKYKQPYPYPSRFGALAAEISDRKQAQDVGNVERTRNETGVFTLEVEPLFDGGYADVDKTIDDHSLKKKHMFVGEGKNMIL